MTLSEHARAIEAAINDAAGAGLYLDNGMGAGVRALELNELDRDGDPRLWVTLELPVNPMTD